MTGFVHLRLHTEYALTDGTVRVEPPKRKGGGQGDTLLTRAAALGFVAVAVTDPTNVYATVKFYKGAEAVGIKPVVGCDLWIAPELPTDAPSRLTVLVQNDTGFRNLSAMLSAAYIDGQSRGRACVSRARLQAHHQGLIALTGRDGALFRAAAADQVGPALAALDELQALFGDRL